MFGFGAGGAGAALDLADDDGGPVSKRFVDEPFTRRQGNLYTAEVNVRARAQKFTMTGFAPASPM